jgi:hypothetical protein
VNKSCDFNKLVALSPMNKDGFEVLGFSHTDIDVSRRQLHNYLLKCGRPEKEARELQNKKKNLGQRK